MTHKPKYSKDEAFHRRMYIHRHNGFMGSARMMEMQANSMLQADSLSPVARATAWQIHQLAGLLAVQLKERIGP